MIRRRRLLLFVVALGFGAVALGWVIFGRDSEPKVSVKFVGYDGWHGTNPVAKFAFSNASSSEIFRWDYYNLVIEGGGPVKPCWFGRGFGPEGNDEIEPNLYAAGFVGTNRCRLRLQFIHFGLRWKTAKFITHIVPALYGPIDRMGWRDGKTFTAYSDWIYPTNLPPPTAVLPPGSSVP